jgi:hypothetical protein
MDQGFLGKGARARWAVCHVAAPPRYNRHCGFTTIKTTEGRKAAMAFGYDRTKRRYLRPDEQDDTYALFRKDCFPAVAAFSDALLRTRTGSRLQRRSAWKQLAEQAQRLELE